MAVPPRLIGTCTAETITLSEKDIQLLCELTAGKTYETIAREMGYSVTWLKARLQRMRQLLDGGNTLSIVYQLRHRIEKGE